MQPVGNDDELCSNFKKLVTSTLEKTKRKTTQFELDDIEKYFHYSAARLQTSFMPKLLREKLASLGVKLHKQRGRDIVEVSLL